MAVRVNLSPLTHVRRVLSHAGLYILVFYPTPACIFSPPPAPKKIGNAHKGQTNPKAPTPDTAKSIKSSRAQNIVFRTIYPSSPTRVQN